MVKVRVLGLRGCSHCETLIKELDSSNIDYTLLDANEHDSLADKVEEFLDIEEYPIVILESISTSYYIFRGQTSESLNESVSGKIVKKGCFTSVDMANYIKKLIHY
jgi:glutaredoxin